MVPEEVAQSYEGPDLFDVAGCCCKFDHFQFGFAGFDAIWGKGEPQVGHLSVAEKAFVQVDLQMVLVQPH
jgi:hypothetical protein